MARQFFVNFLNITLNENPTGGSRVETCGQPYMSSFHARHTINTRVWADRGI